MSSEELLERFWVWRVRGRAFQTLKTDLGLFLKAWQHSAGRQVCIEAYRAAMAREDWDIEQGGQRPMPPLPASPRKKGIVAYD